MSSPSLPAEPSLLDAPRRRRRWMVIVLALVLAAGLAVVGVHLPFARARVLSWAAGQLLRQNVRLDAGHLEYNLLTLSATIETVRLSSTESTQPFFEAAAVRVNLPWSVLRGGVTAETLDIDRPVVTFARQADGSINWPDFGSDDSAGGFNGPVHIDRLRVSDLTIRFDDAIADRHIEAQGLALTMQRTGDNPLAGTLSMAGPATLRMGTQQSTLTTLAGGVTFNGFTVSLTDMAVSTPEAQLGVRGTIDLLGATPQLALQYSLGFDAEPIAAWLGLTPAPSGRLQVDGSAEGPRSSPTFTAAVSTRRFAWSGLDAMTIDGRVGLSGSTITLDGVDVGVAGGTVTVDGRLEVDVDETSMLTAHFRDLSLTDLSVLVPEMTTRPGAIADGTFRMTWSGSVLDADGRLASTFRATAAREDVVPLAGPVDITFGARRWTLMASPQVAGTLSADTRATGRFDADMSGTPLSGTLTIEAPDVAAAVRQLSIVGITPDWDDADPVHGVLSAALALGGTLGNPSVTGTIEGREVTIAGAGPSTLTSDVDADTRIATFRNVTLTSGTNVVNGEATVGIDANTLEGQFDASLADLAAFGTGWPEAWRPSGGASIRAVLSGAPDAPVVAMQLTSPGLVAGGQTFDRATSTATLADDVLTVASFVLTRGAGRLSASGRYGLADGAYALQATGTGLVIDPVPTIADDGTVASILPIHGLFDLTFAGEGTLEAPGGTGQLRFSNLAWDTYQLGASVADVVLSDRTARIHIDLPSVGGIADATIGTSSGALTATMAVTDAELAALIRTEGPAGWMRETPGDTGESAVEAVTGTITLRATAEGVLDNLAAASVVVDADLSNAQINGVPVVVTQPARVRHSNGLFEAESVQLRLGGTTVEMKGRIGAGVSETDALDVSLIGAATDFAQILRLVPGFDAFTADGAVTMQVRASGAIDAPALSAWVIVADGSVSNGDLPPLSDVTLAASYSAGMVSVSTATARWQGADVLAAGHAPAVLLGDRLPPAFLATLPAALEPARFDVRVTGLSPDALRPFLEAESIDQIAGRVDFAADITATALDLDHVTADVRLDRAEVELARIPLAQTGPTRLRLANRRLDVVDWVWAGVGNHLTVNGHVLLEPDAPTMDVSASGSLDLRILSAFMPGVATAGRGIVALTARGAVGDPSIEGRVVLADADLIVRDPRVAITDMSGEALLNGDRITLKGMTATANGGSVAIIGGLDYSDFSVRDGAITITGRGLAFEAIDGLRTELNTDLTIAMTGGTPSVGGRVTVVRGDYREPLRLTEQLLSTYETRVTAGGQAETGALDAIGLDLTIASAEDIIVDNNYGRLEVGSNLRVTGTVGAPVLGGRLAMREGGEVYLGGQSYTLRRGSVDFTNATRIEPDFDVALETRVRNYDITLELSGTPETLEVTLRSPGISQQDALSLLLTGQLADDTSVAYGEVARGQLLMLLSGELLSAAGRAVGLDSVQISRGLGGAASSFDLLATDSDPNARLTLAKNLSRDVELIFSQSLRNTGDITWIATYRPVRQIEFRAATDDNSSQTYEFRHELEFGGAPGAVPVATRLPRTEIHIADVSIDGAPGFSNAEIEAQLRLTRGDRFDYFQWQQDRDRVAALYHDRGFFEARISARRREEPTGLALDYEIRRGPSTTVAVEGFTLPGDVIEGIHTAWTEAVFDGFLIDDVVMLVRRALVRARYLQATVDVTMDAPDGAFAKTLRVVIAAGPRFGTRRVEFTGNSEIPSGALGALVEAAGPDVWMDPASIDGAIEAHYRSRGFLAAAVTVAPARFDGTTAIIAVTVNEGPAYRIGTVGVSGAAFRTADVVRAVAGLEPGEVYLPSAIEPARRAVELDYLAAGYNAVSVSALSGIDESQAIVNVVIAVGEGPKQVLQEIDVSGIGVTSSDTISRALRLEAGAPVNLSDIYAAQKRLYDTGVFRSVDITVEPIDLGPAATPGLEPVEAQVSLTELPRYRFRYGVRVTDLDGPAEGLRQIRPALVLDVLNRNVFGRAISSGIAGQVESDRRLARAILSVPSLFQLPVETNVFLTRSRQTFAPEQARPFVIDRTDFTVEQQFKPRRTMAVTYGYTFGRTRTFERAVEGESGPRRDDRLNVGRFTGTYAWDTRDDPSNATRGWFHSSGVEYAPRRFGSEVSFVRYLAQQYYFRSVGTHAVLASALRVGTARGFDDVVPLAERFYAGGGASVRGFAEQGLGGADVAGVPLGGSGLIVFNQEVRFPVYRWFRGVGFIDAGNVFPTARSLSLSNLASGAGVGLRFNSPFAILRVDYGVPLTGTNRPRRGRWYFAIGQTF